VAAGGVVNTMRRYAASVELSFIAVSSQPFQVMCVYGAELGANFCQATGEGDLAEEEFLPAQHSLRQQLGFICKVWTQGLKPWV